MDERVSVEVPAGFELVARGRCSYVLLHRGTTVGFIGAVEGLYLVRRGARAESATFLGAFHGFRAAIRALTDLGG